MLRAGVVHTGVLQASARRKTPRTPVEGASAWPGFPQAYRPRSRQGVLAAKSLCPKCRWCFPGHGQQAERGQHAQVFTKLIHPVLSSVLYSVGVRQRERTLTQHV